MGNLPPSPTGHCVVFRTTPSVEGTQLLAHVSTTVWKPTASMATCLCWDAFEFGNGFSVCGAVSHGDVWYDSTCLLPVLVKPLRGYADADDMFFT